MPSRVWKSSDAKLNFFERVSRSALPRSVEPSEYSSMWLMPSSPSSSKMMRRAMSSSSLLEGEKCSYLHPYIMGGHALLIWTEAAPLS